MPDQDVLLRVADGVASIVLNRPERRNAITGPLVEGLASAFTSAAERDDVGVVLFHGADGAFCSGLDLKEFNADPQPPWLSTFGRSNTKAHRALYDCPVPVVVALERYAINGGAAYALGGDLIVAGREAFLQVGESASWDACSQQPCLAAGPTPAGSRRAVGAERSPVSRP